MKEKILVVLITFIGLWLMMKGAVGIALKIRQQIDKTEYIKQLEQSLQEQIQETEVYRGILKTYQTEGIINE